MRVDNGTTHRVENGALVKEKKCFSLLFFPDNLLCLLEPIMASRGGFYDFFFFLTKEIFLNLQQFDRL